MAPRRATVNRDTLETRIEVQVDLDGRGRGEFATGVPFLEHMLDQIARHGLIDLTVKAEGDLHIDDHHTVEDIGITFGQAVKQALGERKGIGRYGHAYVPLDEALSRVVIDFPGARDWSATSPSPAPGSAVSMSIWCSNSSRVSSTTPGPRCTSTTCAAPIPTTRWRPSSRPSVAPCARRWRWTRGWGDHALHQGQPVSGCRND